MLQLKTWILMGMLLLPTAAHAETLGEWIHQEISVVQESFLKSGSAAPEGSVLSEFYFKRFFVRLRPKAGVQLVGVARGDLIPEIELAWERPFPEGSETYKP